MFDYRDAAERALGQAWQSMTLAQQAEFVRLFADFLERGYVAFLGTKASVTDGLTVRYLEESTTGETAGVATTLLSRNGNDLDVDYFMVRRGQGWMVRDVIVDGMSLIGNYRAQFSRILTTSSYAELIARMQGDGLEPSQPVIAAAAPVPNAAQHAVVAAQPAEPIVIAPAPATTATQPAAPATQPAEPVGTQSPVVPAMSAPPAPRQELQVATRPKDDAAPKVDVVRASAPLPTVPEPAAAAPEPTLAPPSSASAEPERVAYAGSSRAAAISYWIQVGAFRTVAAAAQLAERLRREGMSASNDKLTSVPWHPAGALARVRVGPFATHSDAQSKLRELTARGYAPFIAEARD